MMRNIGFILALGMLLVPAFAVDWTPPAYDMPRTVIDSETAAYALSGLFNSMRAIGDTGLLIIGILFSVSLVGAIFRWLIAFGGMKKAVGKSREWERNLTVENPKVGESSELREMRVEHLRRGDFKRK